jgi:hypothetical protein
MVVKLPPLSLERTRSSFGSLADLGIYSLADGFHHSRLF